MKTVLWLALGLAVLAVLLSMYQQPRFVISFADLISACF